MRPHNATSTPVMRTDEPPPHTSRPRCGQATTQVIPISRPPKITATRRTGMSMRPIEELAAEESDARRRRLALAPPSAASLPAPIPMSGTECMSRGSGPVGRGD